VIAEVKNSQSLRLDVGPADRSIVGPGLSAVRAACKPHIERLAGLAPVFERIGQHLDTTVSQPGYDGLFCASRRTVVVVVSDVLWGDLVLLTEIRPDELTRALEAYKALEAYNVPFTGRQISDGVCRGWTDWSRHARKSFRRGAPAWSNLASVSVGGLLSVSPDARFELAEVAARGETPVLAIALNSTGTTRKRLKCNVRAIVFPLPSWARASGAVAGHA
jgi:hypothetical protein